MSALTERCRARLKAGEAAADVWNIFRSHVEKLSSSEIDAQFAELDECAQLFPDEARWVSREGYADYTEIETGSREGGDWQFNGFLTELKPYFRFAREASYSFDHGVEAWINFVGRRQIRHWYFENLRYRPAAELARVFTREYFADCTGATLTWIDAGSDSHHALFADTSQWRHWMTLRFEWLRGDDAKHFPRWINLLGDTAVRHFSMQSCNPGKAGFEALANSPAMQQLEELTLLNVYLGNPECEILLKGSYQPRRLKKINLEDCILSSGVPEIDGAMYVRFIQSPFFSGLEHWESRYHCIGPEGMVAMLSTPSRATLRRLSLHNSRLTDAGLKILFDNAWPALRSIYISYDRFSAAQLEWVKTTPLYAQCPEVAIFPMDGPSIYKKPADEAP